MVIEFSRHLPFMKHLGVRLESVGGGRATVALDVRPEHHNSHGIPHGGILLTLLDTAMAQAGRSVARDLGDEPTGVITIEMKSTFLQPAGSDRVFAHGNCIHHTKSLAFCEAEVQDEHGKVLARASGTFKYVRRRMRHDHDPDAKARTTSASPPTTEENDR